MGRGAASIAGGEMIPHLPGPAGLEEGPPVREIGGVPAAHDLEPDPGGRGQPAVRRETKGGLAVHFEAPGRVDEHDVEGGRGGGGGGGNAVAGGRAGEPVEGVRFDHRHRAVRAEPIALAAEAVAHRPAAVDEHRVGGAPGDRLEAERPASREEIEAPRPREVGGEPVEEGLAHPVGGGAHVGLVLHGETAPAPAPSDDSHATDRHSSPTLPARLPCPPRSPPVANMPPAHDIPGAPPPPRSGLLGRLRTALRRTRENLASGLADLFSRGRKIDAGLIDEVEETLLGADVGVELTDRIVADLHDRLKRRRLADGAAVLETLREHMVQALEGVARSCEVPPPAALARPFVVLVVGVNGVGKTTTIGKLAHRFREGGYSVMLAAGDTFRAAAIDQLEVWGKRNGVPVVAQQPGADPAAVVFDALESATARSANVLIADTAGRLHTRTGLMDELAKVRRVLARIDPDAPHETLLVLDATTGQNGLVQARRFTEAVRVSGLAVTKLDGTARGGVLFAIARELAIPIRYIGVGEGIEDLRDFVPADFVDALLARPPGESRSG